MIGDDSMNDLKIRDLIWDDVYVAAGILKNLKVDMTGIDVEEDSAIGTGISIFKNMIANAKDAKVEIDTFLGSLFNITGEEFNKLPLFKAAKCMRQFKEVEGFEDFFSSVKDIVK
mgnify:CR=1 FL=1